MEIREIYPEINIGRAKDITGQHYGKNKKIIPLYRTNNKNNHVTFVCFSEDCQHYFLERSDRLCSKTEGPNIMCPICKEEENNLLNKKIGKLTVIECLGSKNNQIYWKCQCDCGNFSEVSTGELKRGRVHQCKKCLGEDLTGQTFNYLTFLYPTEKRCGNSVVWHCKCNLCGNEKDISAIAVKSGGTISCGCIKSKGEQKIKDILVKNNISFEQQYKIIIPKEGIRFFDFAIYDNNNEIKYLIEFDGIQHFICSNTNWNTQEKFIKTQLHDKQKNEWCKENGIPLIRIPYTHFNNLCLEDLLLETSLFII